MHAKLGKWTIHHSWILLFGIWVALLSGAFTRKLGSPGILQVIQLKRTLALKTHLSSQLERETGKLKHELVDLEKNPFVQLREIRRVLGYTAPDEIVFDFESLP